MAKFRNRCTPRVSELEARCLLAGQSPTAVWLGQNGQDLVGGSSSASPNDGVQDVDILLSNLPAARTIVSASMTGDGGDLWVYGVPGWNPWYATIVFSSGSAT